MTIKRIIRTLLILAILSSNIGCDQITKNIARQRIEYNEQIPVVGNFFTFTKIENTGAFLSLGQSLTKPFKIFLLTILPILVLAMGLVYLITKKRLSMITVTGACFVIGGGVGNIYDRVLYGSVTDFMHMNFGIFQTGIFNMADVSIMVGMFLLLFESSYREIKLLKRYEKN